MQPMMAGKAFRWSSSWAKTEARDVSTSDTKNVRASYSCSGSRVGEVACSFSRSGRRYWPRATRWCGTRWKGR